MNVSIWHITECKGCFPTITRKLEEPFVLETTQSSHRYFPSVIYLRPLGPHMKESFSTCRNVVGDKETLLLTVSRNRGNCSYSYKQRKEWCWRLLSYRTYMVCNWSCLYVVLQTQLVCARNGAKACVWHKSCFAEERGPLERLPLSSLRQCLEIPFSPVLHICWFLVSFCDSSCTSHLFGTLLSFLFVWYHFSRTKQVNKYLVRLVSCGGGVLNVGLSILFIGKSAWGFGWLVCLCGVQEDAIYIL